MAFPLKKDQISIHYTGAGQRKENTRFVIKHTLKEKNAIQTCEQITAAIQKKRNSIHNEHGWLILQPREIILSAEKATSRKGSGIFYVITKGLYFEHEKKGLGFKLPYSMFKECHIKGSKITIKYTEIHSNREEEFHEYEILLSVKERIKKTVQKIRDQYKESHAQDQHEFDILEKKFVNFKGIQLRKILMQKSIDQKTGDAMEDMLPLIPNLFDLMTTRVTEASYELQKYIGYIADDMFGNTRPKVQWCLCSNWFVRNTIFGDSGQCFEKFHPNGSNREQIRTNPEKVMTNIDQIIQAHVDFHFRMLEMRLVKTALLLDVPLDKIGKHTDQYKEMMAEYEKDFEHHRKCEMEHHKWKIKYESMKADIEAKSKTKDEYEGMIKKEEFVNCVRQYKKYTDERAKYNIHPQTFYSWKEKFVEGGKASLNGTPNGNVCKNLQKENDSLKRLIGEIAIANDILKEHN